jgi:hypothetical protein
MSWQARLRNIVLAGGAVACREGATGPGTNGGAVCNANPDPCCQLQLQPVDANTPMALECAAAKACRASGGAWSDPYITGHEDGGVPHCVQLDAGVPDAR